MSMNWTAIHRPIDRARRSSRDPGSTGK